MPEPVKLIQGNRFEDHRGTLNFFNEFSFDEVCRVYTITPSSTELVRAWQGHALEHKYFMVAYGRFAVAWVALDDFENPSHHLEAQHTILSSFEPAILSIPAGHANGFRALEPGSVLTIFSNKDLATSESDRWSYDSSLWFDWTKNF
jgi:dTDP-4-dehydrorhamnose 3,5-epimerase-like enzyme